MRSLRALDPKNFDTSTSPSVDFYRHANGAWLDANPVPAEYGAWGAFHEVHVRNEDLLQRLMEEAVAAGGEPGSPTQMVGDYYSAGMDTSQIEASGVEPLLPWLSQIEAMSDLSALRAVAAAMRPYGIRLLFGSYVSADFDDSTEYLLYLSQGGLGLPERDYYFREDERSTELRQEYVGHIEAMLDLVGGSDHSAADAGAILALETRLAEASLAAAELRDVDRTTNKRTIAELTDLTPNLDIASYLGAIGAQVTHVNLNHPDFFSALDAIVAETPIDVLRAYARWHVIRSTASSLPARFEDEAFRFYGQILGGQKEQRDRWKRVLGAASGDIGQQVSRLYVDAAFSPEAKVRCEVMVANIIEAMGDSIRDLEWMGAETKDKALTKLDAFHTKIGYPDEWRDYTGLEITTGPYVVNRMAAAAFEFKRKLAKLGQPVESEWELPPHAVNAYYHPSHNEIVFPAGILQPPFFDSDADDPVIYGGIGAVIGHEITHGFDDQGSKFDALGNLANWWTDDDRQEFDRRAEGLVAQFDAFSVDDDLNVNGQLTLGENIADLGGVAIAFAALERAHSKGSAHPIDGFSPEQRFFLSYATIWRTNYTDEYLRLITTTDPHSPGQHRCNGPLTNFPPFHTAFAVEGSSPMRRSGDDVVRIW